MVFVRFPVGVLTDGEALIESEFPRSFRLS
jgi:hypothetical protein